MKRCEDSLSVFAKLAKGEKPLRSKGHVRKRRCWKQPHCEFFFSLFFTLKCQGLWRKRFLCCRGPPSHPGKKQKGFENSFHLFPNNKWRHADQPLHNVGQKAFFCLQHNVLNFKIPIERASAWENLHGKIWKFWHGHNFHKKIHLKFFAVDTCVRIFFFSFLNCRLFLVILRNWKSGTEWFLKCAHINLQFSWRYKKKMPQVWMGKGRCNMRENSQASVWPVQISNGWTSRPLFFAGVPIKELMFLKP